MPLTPAQLTLFAAQNYRFSTTERGRMTSLYFQDLAGNQGRWRREHRDGEALIYQGQSRRLFLHGDEMPNYMSGLENDPLNRDGGQFNKRANGDFNVLSRNVAIRNLSLAPVNDYHVLELCPPQFYPRHGSSGEVLLNDPSAAAANYAGVGAIAQTIVW